MQLPKPMPPRRGESITEWKRRCAQFEAAKVPLELPDLASRIAAPVWALVWVMTLGRMGKPLWSLSERERALAVFRRGYNLTSQPGGLEIPPIAQFSHMSPPPDGRDLGRLV